MFSQNQQNFDNDIFIPLEKTFGQHFKSIGTDIQNQKNQQQNKNNSQFVDNQQYQLLLHGFPYDEGTYRKGGRMGGEKGTKIFRQMLPQEICYPNQLMLEKIVFLDTGDLPKIDQNKNEYSLEDAHSFQLEKVHSLLQFSNNSIPILIGGSQDQSYYNAKALMKLNSNQNIAVININSHLCVSPFINGKEHAASCFKQLLEDEDFKNKNNQFIEFGVQGSQAQKSEFEYLKNLNCPIYWLEKDIRRRPLFDSKSINQIDVKKLEVQTQAGGLMVELLQKLDSQNDITYIYISFDLDSINSSYCPGVSEPSVVGGLTDFEALEICYLAGMFQKVKMIDLSEFNPAVESQRTASLMVNMLYMFAKGVSERQ